MPAATVELGAWMDFSQALAPFLTGKFWGTTMAISVVMTTLVKSLRIVAPTVIQSKAASFLLTWTNIVAGVLAAISPSYIQGDTFAERLPFGICAGGVSHFAYKWFLRRFKFFGGKKGDQHDPPVPKAVGDERTEPDISLPAGP